MKAKYLLSSLAILGGVALVAPAFAQQDQAPQPNANAAPSTTAPENYSAQQNGMPPDSGAQSQSDQSAQMQPKAAAGSNDMDKDMGSAPQRSAEGRHNRSRAHHMARRHEGAGRYGMDVAPGGGVYTRQDVANEAPDRMSHPVVGERRAPGDVAKGSLANIDEAENAITARLNQEQFQGNHETASLPSQ